MVDTIDTAQKCVTFLKEQNIGVATFIGLDKVKRITVNHEVAIQEACVCHVCYTSLLHTIFEPFRENIFVLAVVLSFLPKR